MEEVSRLEVIIAGGIFLILWILFRIEQRVADIQFYTKELSETDERR